MQKEKKEGKKDKDKDEKEEEAGKEWGPRVDEPEGSEFRPHPTLCFPARTSLRSHRQQRAGGEAHGGGEAWDPDPEGEAEHGR